MECAADLVHALQSCPCLTEFLERDLKSTNEVGFMLGEHGTVYDFREGTHSSLTVAFPPDVNERRILIHTHPTIDTNVTFSDTDRALCNHDSICGIIALSRDMFDVHWKGRALLARDDGTTDETKFHIECDGTTDGPARDRWVANPQFR